MRLAPTRPFQSVQEGDDSFLSLWPHRYDYLWAEHPNPNERPEWQTESRHPLSDRLLQQGAALYGVRFGPTTRYCVLDIDKGSAYHPTHDRFAWRRMLGALEALGLVQTVACTSSYSSGLHLYLPFDSEQKTWAIALAVSTLLENAGFKLAPGQLEVFPNCKAYAASGELSLYNGHRLPMQAGSYLLNDDLQMIWGTQQTFVQHWQFAQQRNSLDTKALERIIKSARRRQFRITGKADKFLNDLNAEIEQGWTGPGQTNRLLGRIAMRSYIFGHVLYSETLLEGEDLVLDIVKTARSLPGYAEWCQHQHEIEQRAAEWANAVESSDYYPYANKRLKVVDKQDQSTWNEIQAERARERIRSAIADLLEKGCLPGQVTARREAIRAYKIGNTTLDKNLDLWHPDHLNPTMNQDDHPGSAEADPSECLDSAQGERYQPIEEISLGGRAGLCAPQEQQSPSPHFYGDIGGSGGISTGGEVAPLACSGPKDIAKLLKSNAERRRAKNLEEVLSTSERCSGPPDETYFRASDGSSS